MPVNGHWKVEKRKKPVMGRGGEAKLKLLIRGGLRSIKKQADKGGKTGP